VALGAERRVAGAIAAAAAGAIVGDFVGFQIGAVQLVERAILLTIRGISTMTLPIRLLDSPMW
jgi:hypothetical protein